MNEVNDIGRLDLELQRARLGQGEQSQVLDEPLQHLHLVEKGGHVLGPAIVNTIDDGFDLAADHRERRSELVTQV